MKSLLRRTQTFQSIHHTIFQQSQRFATTKSKVEGQAIRIYETGGVDKLTQEKVQYAPSDNDLLIRNEYAGLNFIDTYHRTGLYPFPSYPVTLGVDGCGVIEAIKPEI
eukprot:329193_1